MCIFLGRLCHRTGKSVIHIRAHRRRIGCVPPSPGSQSGGWRPDANNVAIITTIHGLLPGERATHLKPSSNDFPREVVRLLTERLGCRGSVVQDPVAGPVVYLEGDHRYMVESWLIWGSDGPWIELARVKVHDAVDEEWGG
ncbi:hypothetical protein PG995_009504 [Apiospora arundinis]